MRRDGAGEGGRQRGRKRQKSRLKECLGQGAMRTWRRNRNSGTYGADRPEDPTESTAVSAHKASAGVGGTWITRRGERKKGSQPSAGASPYFQSQRATPGRG